MIKSILIDCFLYLRFGTTQKKLAKAYYRLTHLQYEEPTNVWVYQLIAYGSYVDILPGGRIERRFVLNEMDHGMTCNIWKFDKRTNLPWTRVYYQTRSLTSVAWIGDLLALDAFLLAQGLYRERMKQLEKQWH